MIVAFQFECHMAFVNLIMQSQYVSGVARA
ncbi:hypothetical protein BAAM1489_07200 [Bifidobacterium animalis subsp. animalis MCC 1489]|uniref:Uncharacterized protein n=1 Tax=Bifidobacterium animalis subsp. animalis MCC 0483 TaxID=1365955 RepID=A0AB34T841_9BIFI|nr:hypothetical protein BAAM0483_06825 [Bifidobacterium animalis subsp. animalis MCC 0483]KOA55306.1 hypothetical protein BAAA27672_06035 [Bifidobacterium animalis subsp. animalis ATCC 27672]KOA62226.1 hypothetical protein BAAM0499_00040 [Bifidobacterium animalis subsp. animalis MCC 0499]KOA63099.1 hypothetical protein BAAM1489_07200 [Bifidobacterium animalis subsp. animalis MCC 1489]